MGGSTIAARVAHRCGRGLQRFLGSHSHRGVRNALERLAAQGVVLVEEAPPAKLYRLNRDHLAAAYIVGLSELASEFFQRRYVELFEKAATAPNVDETVS